MVVSFLFVVITAQNALKMRRESEAFYLLWHTLCIQIVFLFCFVFLNCVSIFTELHCACHVYEIPCKSHRGQIILPLS